MTADPGSGAPSGRHAVAWSEEQADRVLEPFRAEHDVLVALQAVQAAFGWVPAPAVPRVAAACNVSRADVYGVLTFYSDLRSTPPPAHEVRVCLGEACQAVGARELLAAARGLRARSGDDLEVTPVYCLGNCALGPSATVDGRLVGRATVDVLRAGLRPSSQGAS